MRASAPAAAKQQRRPATGPCHAAGRSLLPVARALPPAAGAPQQSHQPQQRAALLVPAAAATAVAPPPPAPEPVVAAVLPPALLSAAALPTSLIHGLGSVGEVSPEHMPWLLRLAHVKSQASGHANDSAAALQAREHSRPDCGFGASALGRVCVCVWRGGPHLDLQGRTGHAMAAQCYMQRPTCCACTYIHVCMSIQPAR